MLPVTLLAAVSTTTLQGAAYFFYWRSQYLISPMRADSDAGVPISLYACAASVMFLFAVINIHVLRVFHSVVSAPPPTVKLYSARVCMGFAGLASGLFPGWCTQIFLLRSALYSPRAANAHLAEVTFAVQTLLLIFSCWYPWCVTVADYFQRGVRRAADHDLPYTALRSWQSGSAAFSAQYALEIASRKRRMSPSPANTRI